MTIKRASMLVACIGIASAAPVATASPLLTGTVAELYVNDSSHTNVVYISVGTSFASSCGATSTYLVIDLSEASMKEAYAMALSASMAGRVVRMGGVGGCYGQYEKLKYIYVTQ